MTPIPIIIPMNTQTNCIIQEGVRYCESGNLSNHIIGIVLLGTLAYGLWFALCWWITDTYFDYSVAVFSGLAFGLPLLIGGITLLLI